MELNLKVWKGMKFWVFRDKGKFVGYLGIKVNYPVSAQQILEQIK
jgi:hypothetical protein